MRVSIVGANGQLGMDCQEAFAQAGHKVSSVLHNSAPIEDEGALRSVLSEQAPEVVLNASAYNKVAECENDTETPWKVNALGPRNLAILSNELGFRLLHVSTDYVFDGMKKAPYREDDLPLPLNVYGNTKLAGEHFVSAIAKDGLTLRTSGVYGKHPCRSKGYDFVEMMLKLAAEKPEVRVVDDEVLTPTPTATLARQLVDVADHEIKGVCHATPQGGCSWYEFASEIWRIKGLETPLKKAGPGEFPSNVRRPAYSVLDNLRLREAGIDRFKSWQEELAAYLKG